MKKQTKQLTLNKKTISNLQASEMEKKIGGYWTLGPGCHWNGKTKNCTQNQNTCMGHNTWYTCVTCA